MREAARILAESAMIVAKSFDFSKLRLAIHFDDGRIQLSEVLRLPGAAKAAGGRGQNLLGREALRMLPAETIRPELVTSQHP
jgi:hypothetical protein